MVDEPADTSADLSSSAVGGQGDGFGTSTAAFQMDSNSNSQSSGGAVPPQVPSGGGVQAEVLTAVMQLLQQSSQQVGSRSLPSSRLFFLPFYVRVLDTDKRCLFFISAASSAPAATAASAAARSAVGPAAAACAGTVIAAANVPSAAGFSASSRSTTATGCYVRPLIARRFVSAVRAGI